MPKRKKSSVYDDAGGPEVGTKRKKYDLSEQLQELMESLRNYKTPQGKQICETFIRAPKRRNLAEYYEVVSTPIDLLRIQQKIRMDEYDDLEQFHSDIELLVNNTKSYFKPDTAEYADAVKLWDVYLLLKGQVFGSTSSSGASTTSSHSADGDSCKNDSSAEDDTGGVSEPVADEKEDELEELFGAVMTAPTDDDRQLSTMFELLPSAARYPDYYEIVTEPIDLKTIALKIQNRQYDTLADLEKDLLLMVRNAKVYNAPGSQIYKDANALKKIVQQRRAEIESRRTAPGHKSSQRIRAKRQTPYQQKWSTIAAAFKDEAEEQGMDEATAGASSSGGPVNSADFDDGTNDLDNTENFSDSEPDQSEQSNPQWLLYQAVTDTPHSEPFIRLPSRRMYPDYYTEIKQPICLSQIGNKIKNSGYENINDLLEELTLVFENAMIYNRPDSKIYKDAAKLKRILQMKAREIISAFREGAEYDDDDDDDGTEAMMMDDQDAVPSPTKKSTSGQRASRSSKRSMVNAMSQELKNVRRSQKADQSEQKKRMMALYQHLLECHDQDRYIIDPFMEKPSKKLYPDYYDVIESPIDMKTIDAKIKSNQYQSEKALVNDFRLMFANCRKYNEDDSLIYQDADRLEAELNMKLEELASQKTATDGTDQQRSGGKKERVRPSSATQLKIKTLYETVRDYTDAKGRLLSAIFQKLPSRGEFPDYYEVISKPICLEKIGQRVKNGVYETVEDLLSDIILMLDNACKYNEPDSQIFKDALTLQQVALQTKIELNEDSVNGIPDVKIIVQDLLTNLFISVYNHQDEEGRCFSDSINELSEVVPGKPENSEGVELKTLNFDIIKRNLNLGRYRRMDRFQQDMFEVLERARKMSRTDSQAFEDSIELQTHFIALRDELCRNGQVLTTTALLYDLATLNAHIEALRREKVPKEITEDTESNRTGDDKDGDPIGVDSMPMGAGGGAIAAGPMQTVDHDDELLFHQDMMLKVGDFVYVQPHEKAFEPHIVYIESFKKDFSDQTLIHGCWFYRPYETYHLASRKFLEKEVFKSDNYTTTPLSQVVGKCSVMFVKDYFRCHPVGIDDKDVYVCESRYSSKGKSFKKIKIWPCLQNTAYVMRSTLLPMNRVPSVFAKNRPADQAGLVPAAATLADDLESESAEAGGLAAADVSILDVPRPNVACQPPEDIVPLEGAQYYEQFSIPVGTFRVGDCCYVRTDQERNLICRIDRIWVDQDGNPFFHGPWYVQQAELPANTIGSFYPQEVFLSSIEDTNPLLSICDRCCVMDVPDYCNWRRTEFPEKDVYVCEIRYLEHEKKFEPLPEGGVKKFQYQNVGVVPDEIYHFRKPLVLCKPSYQLPRVVEEQLPLYPKLTADGQIQLAANMDTISADDSTNDTITGIPASVMPPPSAVPPPTMVSAISMHGGDQLIQGGLTPNTPSTISMSGVSTPTTSATTPVSGSSNKKKSKRLVTGYIIFASEVRRSTVESNPDCSFGDISRLIGIQWKMLTPEQKNDYEQRAAKQNAEVKEYLAAEKALMESMPPCSPVATAGQPMENGVFECRWANKCDFQFEEAQDLFEHLTAEPNGHVWISYADTKDKDPGEFQCMFYGCGRVKKGAAPFPSIQRLIRHCKEVHVNKLIPKHVDPDKRSRNYVPSSKNQVAVAGGQVNTVPTAQFQTINLQPQQLSLQQQVASGSAAIPIMTQQGQTIMATHHPQAQLVAGQPGTFIQHQIIQPGQSLQGMLHQPGTVVSSVPQSAIQIQAPQQIQIQPTTLAQQMPLIPQPPPVQKISIGVQVKPVEPIFVSPPRANRLLHTHAYMKYIENLKPDRRFISNWDRQLTATGPENGRPAVAVGKDEDPGSWLAVRNNNTTTGSIEQALWALRNFMFKDALNLAQHC